MKKNVLILLIFTGLFNCTVKEKPEFIGVEKIEVISANKKSITFSADALFKNPNDLGDTLKTDNLKVLINNNVVATFSSKSFEVPKQDNFTIPLTVSIATDSIFGRKNLGGLLGSLISQKLNVQYKGEIKYKLLGFSSTYDVNEIQDIKIKF